MKFHHVVKKWVLNTNTRKQNGEQNKNKSNGKSLKKGQ